jgi:hypothetical protein
MLRLASNIITGYLLSKLAENNFYLYIYGSTVLLLELGRFFQFFNPIHSRYDALDGGSARRKAATYTGQHKRRHPYLECDPNPQSQRFSERRYFIP